MEEPLQTRTQVALPRPRWSLSAIHEDVLLHEKLLGIENHGLRFSGLGLRGCRGLGFRGLGV